MPPTEFHLSTAAHVGSPETVAPFLFGLDTPLVFVVYPRALPSSSGLTRGSMVLNDVNGLWILGSSPRMTEERGLSLDLTVDTIRLKIVSAATSYDLTPS